MLISATDLSTGVYGSTQPGMTMQGPASPQFKLIDGQLVNGAANTNVNPVITPLKAALTPPTGFSSWQAAYQAGVIS